MYARLIDVRVSNFTGKDSSGKDKTIKGYKSAFIVPARYPDKYSPTIVLFYTSEEDSHNFGEHFKKLLQGAEYITDLNGIGDYQIGYVYDSNRTLQKLTYLEMIPMVEKEQA